MYGTPHYTILWILHFHTQNSTVPHISPLCYIIFSRLGGKFHPRYLPVEFTGISRHGKKDSSGKYWQIMGNIAFLPQNTGKYDF